MVYYLFVGINGITFIAVFNLASFMAILKRIASVLYMEEYAYRNNDVNAEEAGCCSGKEGQGFVDVKNASYGWGFRVET